MLEAVRCNGRGQPRQPRVAPARSQPACTGSTCRHPSPPAPDVRPPPIRPAGRQSAAAPAGPVARPATPPADLAAHPPLPAAAKMMEEQHLAPVDVGAGTGKDGRITKGDVLAFLNRPAPAPAAPPAAKAPREPMTSANSA